MPHKKKKRKKKGNLLFLFFKKQKGNLLFLFFIYVYYKFKKKTFYFIYLVKPNCCFLKKITKKNVQEEKTMYQSNQSKMYLLILLRTRK